MATKQRRPEDDEEEGQRDRFVVLLRHGESEEKTEEKADEERSLTADGHANMKQVALGLEVVFPKAQAIFSSPLTRAQQSALWIARAYRTRVKIATSEALRPGATYEQFVEMLDSTKDRRIIVVGHEPVLTAMMAKLIGVNDNSHGVDLHKGGCLGVRLRADGKNTLEWLLSPRILRKLSESD